LIKLSILMFRYKRDGLCGKKSQDISQRRTKYGTKAHKVKTMNYENKNLCINAMFVQFHIKGSNNFN